MFRHVGACTNDGIQVILTATGVKYNPKGSEEGTEGSREHLKHFYHAFIIELF